MNPGAAPDNTPPELREAMIEAWRHPNKMLHWCTCEFHYGGAGTPQTLGCKYPNGSGACVLLRDPVPGHE
jgi:hypothetical protein